MSALSSILIWVSIALWLIAHMDFELNTRITLWSWQLFLMFVGMALRGWVVVAWLLQKRKERRELLDT